MFLGATLFVAVLESNETIKVIHVYVVIGAKEAAVVVFRPRRILNIERFSAHLTHVLSLKLC